MLPALGQLLTYAQVVISFGYVSPYAGFCQNSLAGNICF